MRATVYCAASRMHPVRPSGSSHSLLRRTSTRSHVEHLADLLDVRARVRVDRFARQHRPRFRAPGRIADARSEVADEKDHVVAELLELPELLQQHGVAEMEIGGGGIEARLHAQRLAAREAAREARLRR